VLPVQFLVEKNGEKTKDILIGKDFQYEALYYRAQTFVCLLVGQTRKSNRSSVG